MPDRNGYHSLVAAFQAEVITRALVATGGNRLHAARLLGLQRTYLLRLMRDRSIEVPRAPRTGRHRNGGPASADAPVTFRIEFTGWEPLTPPNGHDQHPESAMDLRHRAERAGVAPQRAPNDASRRMSFEPVRRRSR